MSTLQKITAAVLLALLLAAGYGWWVTSQSATPVRALGAQPGTPAPGGVPVIDENTLLTAQRLARRATTPEEQPLAQAAVQTADHELDLAFAATLRHLEAHPPPLSPEALQIQQHLQEAQKTLAADQESLKRLTAQLAQAADPDKAAIQDRIDLAQSQVELGQDVIQEANQDLMQAGGNVHQRIQMMQQEHEATEHSGAATAPPAQPPGALGSLNGVVGQLREWLTLHEKRRWLLEARTAVSDSADRLAAERAQIADELAASKARLPQFGVRTPQAAATPDNIAGATAGAHVPAAPTRATGGAAPVAASPAASSAARTAAPATRAASSTPPPGSTEPTTLLGLTRQIAAEQHRLTLRDERITTRRRLAGIYGKWETVVTSQARTVLHQCLTGAAVVMAVLLLLLFADRSLERLLARARIDRRQLATLRSVIGVALQLVGVLVILLALVGLPGQIGTMLGIVGAGLTVALKDFIVAFIGWIVLMGRNGMRLGDWVEINGVSGEVVELNMFHTVLLETGNWTDAGHPTGRRVTFTNSFAISGHYFNFSTSGQWLWDELSVVVPFNRDSHALADAILKEVKEATAKDAAQAEEEWRRASRGQRGGSVTAQPAIAVRPASGGVEVAVRYVTRAGERQALRARLYQSAVQLLGEPLPATAG
jgi:small-conductance mechanosensitive channel